MIQKYEILYCSHALSKSPYFPEFKGTAGTVDTTDIRRWLQSNNQYLESNIGIIVVLLKIAAKKVFLIMTRPLRGGGVKAGPLRSKRTF